MNHALITALGVLADETPRDTGPEFGKASPFGLLVIVLLLLGTVILVWSMNRQLKKVPPSFDRANPEPGGPDKAGGADERSGDAGAEP
ncbi:MAG: hypothetical protein ACRDU4_13375 [Mycobacterium sp.]